MTKYTNIIQIMLNYANPGYRKTVVIVVVLRSMNSGHVLTTHFYEVVCVHKQGKVVSR